MTTDDKQARLREIEADIASLRRELGTPNDEPKDFGDQGADLAQREEQASLIENLEAERQKLLDELGQS